MLRFITPSLLFFATNSLAALQPLEEHNLAQISGQAGITLDQGHRMAIGEFKYTDDGNDLKIQGIQFSAKDDINESSQSRYVIDVLSDGSLQLSSTVQPSKMTIAGLKIGNSASLGGLILDYEGVTDLTLRGKAGGGYEGSFTTGISNANLTWVTNGHSLSFENIGYNASIDNLSLDYGVASKPGAIVLGLTNFAFSFSSGALTLANTSMGELAGSLALDGAIDLYGGGRTGQGIHLDSQITILNNPANFVRFTDEGSSLLLGDFNGSLNLDNLTLDVESDHLALQFDQMDGSFKAGRILIGDSTKPVGSIELDFLFDNSNGGQNLYRLYPGIRQPTFNTLPSQIRSYAQDFYAGLDGASEGLSAAVQWNLANADISYIDDGRRVIISGIESQGSANTTFDVRNQKVGVGVSNLVGSYSIDGLKVGSKSAPIQGGAELLLSLEVFQAMDFDINGYTEITAGGVSGGGIRVDGDYFFSDSNIALSIDENEEGVWATGVNYDIHLRDITFDVETDGVQINRGEQWSTMDIANLRWGNKNTGRSLGRIVLERFEKNSALQIIPGGAGQVCVGATATAEGACTAGGGRWEDRGEQGMTVALKAAFANAGPTTDGTATARNRLTWENNRSETSPGSGDYVNGSGTQIIFDNYSTNDGLGTSDSNDYGFQANLNVDVFETKVLKKTGGADANGVSGNIGDELIYDDSSRTNYSYVANPSSGQQALRPQGFAVQGNVSFKEFNVDAVQLKHPDVAAPQTVFYGVVLQNLNLTTNLTATPIQ